MKENIMTFDEVKAAKERYDTVVAQASEIFDVTRDYIVELAVAKFNNMNLKKLNSIYISLDEIVIKNRSITAVLMEPCFESTENYEYVELSEFEISLGVEGITEHFRKEKEDAEIYSQKRDAEIEANKKADRRRIYEELKSEFGEPG